MNFWILQIYCKRMREICKTCE